MKKEAPMDAAGDKLMQELRDVVAAAEEMLAAATTSRSSCISLSPAASMGASFFIRDR